MSASLASPSLSSSLALVAFSSLASSFSASLSVEIVVSSVAFAPPSSDASSISEPRSSSL